MIYLAIVGVALCGTLSAAAGVVFDYSRKLALVLWLLANAVGLPSAIHIAAGG